MHIFKGARILITTLKELLSWTIKVDFFGITFKVPVSNSNIHFCVTIASFGTFLSTLAWH